jgi:hypothetical protein
MSNIEDTNENIATIGDNGAPKYSLKQLLKDASVFGEAAKQGQAALPALALEVASASYERVLNIAGAGDDIDTIFKAYMAGRSKQKDVTSIPAQVSKLRKIAKVSQFAGTDDDGYLRTVADMLTDADAKFQESYNDAELRKQMVKCSRYDFLLKLASLQAEKIGDAPIIADVDVLTSDEINSVLLPKEADPKTVADKAWSIFKKMKKLKEGTKAKDDGFAEGGEPVNEPELDDAIESFTQLMWKLDPAKMEKDAQAEQAKASLAMQAAAFGLKLTASRKAA